MFNEHVRIAWLAGCPLPRQEDAAMRKQKIPQKTIICVNGECFGDSSSATHHFLELASHGQKVTLTRWVEVETDGTKRDDGALATISAHPG